MQEIYILEKKLKEYAQIKTDKLQDNLFVPLKLNEQINEEL
jgi:hypothetical protein